MGSLQLSKLHVNEINAKGSDVTAITINNSGFVAPKVPLFRAVLTSNQTGLASNQYHLIDFSGHGTVEVDNCNGWDSANEKWTPTVAGWYQVNAVLDCGAGSIRAAGPVVYKNGSLHTQNILWLGAESYGDDIGGSFSTIIELNGSTDYIQLYGYLYDSGAGTDDFVGGNGKTGFSAHFVSR